MKSMLSKISLFFIIMFILGCNSNRDRKRISERYSYILDKETKSIIIFDNHTNASVSLSDQVAGFSFQRCDGSVHVGNGEQQGMIYISKKINDNSFKVVRDTNGDLEWDERFQK